MPVPVLPVDFFGAAERALRAGPPVVRSIQAAPVSVDDDLVVTSETNRYDPVTDVFTFERGVVARYGPTTVRAERLVVDRRLRKAQATGNVRVEDPEAELSADNLDFSWDPLKRTGHAENVRARLANVNISAREANISPERWELLDVAGSSCGQRTPLYQIRTRRLVVTPGRSGRAERPNVYLLGRRILTLPDRSFSLDPRTQGFQFPAISYRRDGQVGVSWNSGFLVNSQTNLALNFSTFPNVRPGYGIIATRTFLPAEKSTDIVTPSSEFSERFRYGFLENIQVRNPDQERRFLRTNRKAVSIASQFNQGVVGRRIDLSFSKPLEVVGELGGAFRGDGGYLTQARLQAIQRGGESVNTRAVLIGSALLPSYSIAPGLNTLVRLDTTSFVGDDLFGWVRGLVGVTYKPLRQVTLSGGAVLAGEFGTATYREIDPLYAKDGYVMRADVDLGTTRVGYMQKWDRRLGMYDREYYASQAIGCLEPFVLYRKYPGEYQLGLRFRLDEFYDLLRRREFKRTKPVRTNIPADPPPRNK
jgi:lipopolysaccharide export system protein LptA